MRDRPAGIDGASLGSRASIWRPLTFPSSIISLAAIKPYPCRNNQNKIEITNIYGGTHINGVEGAPNLWVQGYVEMPARSPQLPLGLDFSSSTATR